MPDDIVEAINMLSIAVNHEGGSLERVVVDAATYRKLASFCVVPDRVVPRGQEGPRELVIHTPFDRVVVAI